ncbi:MAG: hypothetical protein J0H23_05010 [Micrococcales bacterium]|nr:hypothetical protein [Micrococcales bacterium]OJX66041.1 MAG: hypothetical protein BGO94_03710 [Micrococcales bacterium 72-143]
MRRAERITMWTGAVLVAATAIVAIAVLAVQGSRPIVRPERSEVIPADIAWTVFSVCWTETPSTAGSMAVSTEVVDERGRVEVIESDLTEEETHAYESAIDDCLARYRIEDPNAAVFAGGEYVDTPAERMLLADIGWRWMLPCVAEHGVDGYVPKPSDYLSESQAPWMNYYAVADLGRPDVVDTVLAARLDCGPGAQPYAG